jgi:hypothetical protein
MITEFVRRLPSRAGRPHVEGYANRQRCPACGNLNLEIIHQHGHKLNCRLCGRPCLATEPPRSDQGMDGRTPARPRENSDGDAHWKVLRRDGRGEPYLQELCYCRTPEAHRDYIPE